MKDNMENKIPETLDEAIEILKEGSKEHTAELKEMSEDDFVGTYHHGAGTNMRNSWHLWWHENHGYKEWPKEKPKIVEYFNSLGIYHADDMSGIIMESFHRSINGKPLELEEQVEWYKKFWKKEGFKDGIFKPDKKDV